MRKKFKGIASGQYTERGQMIISGQKVKAYGRLTKEDEYEVEFSPDFGFTIYGDNLADRVVLEVTQKISWFNRLLGNLRFTWYNLTIKTKKNDHVQHLPRANATAH